MYVYVWDTSVMAEFSQKPPEGKLKHAEQTKINRSNKLQNQNDGTVCKTNKNRKQYKC